MKERKERERKKEKEKRKERKKERERKKTVYLLRHSTSWLVFHA